MRYLSTRGDAPELGFAEVLLGGLAPDGGLYVPAEWPRLPELPPPGASGGYAADAAAIMAAFVGDDLDAATLARLCDEAYATFRHPAVVPLVQIDHHHWLLELFHGPTLAFKDVALQLVGRMFDHVLGQRGERVTIVGATSGDTGSAAIDGVKGCDHVDIVILYPAGRTSDVQRRQMTTIDAPNVHTVAIDGTFDDCQDLVKAMFADAEFRDRLRLSAVNSINWARVMAQVVYYVTASRALAGPVTFCVPTGNFGNVLAGWIARRCGAPIADFIVASNTNDILTRFVNDADMTTREVVPTLSPSMDIQVSSNFERLLFEMNGRDGGMTAEQLRRFRSTGRLDVEPDQRREWVEGTFRAASLGDAATTAEIARTFAETGMLIDPHTATGVGAVRRLVGAGGPEVPIVTTATAHPAKFPDAVERATGVRPGLPPHLADLFDLPERTASLPNDLAAVQEFVTARSRVGR
ncbi:MAG: threonine synthase [Ilumatobacter sp.]|nr:MAG: threonine synthase [Ilumatobacter sp.]